MPRPSWMSRNSSNPSQSTTVCDTSNESEATLDSSMYSSGTFDPDRRESIQDAQRDVCEKIQAVYDALPPFLSDYHECWKVLRTRVTGQHMLTKVCCTSKLNKQILRDKQSPPQDALITLTTKRQKNGKVSLPSIKGLTTLQKPTPLQVFPSTSQVAIKPNSMLETHSEQPSTRCVWR